ncbi:MAG: LEA type 2 family protein [Fibrobacteres bacterium]|nr:LEA type 2 family protein [Fibrobacterota bacterium]
MRRHILAAVAILISMTGCGLKAERSNLRNCTFVPLSWNPIAQTGDTLRFTIGLEIGNPTSQPATLDSFRLLASTRSPVAVLTHGSSQKVAPGGKDTVEVQLAITKSAIAATALQMVFSPPDSLTVEGEAWVPGILWGWNRHEVRTRFDLGPHMDKIRNLLGKAIKP